MTQPENLRLEASAPLDPQQEAHAELRCQVNGACLRLDEVLAALRVGRVIDVYEGLLDVRADLRSALNYIG